MSVGDNAGDIEYEDDPEDDDLGLMLAGTDGMEMRASMGVISIAAGPSGSGRRDVLRRARNV